MDYDFAYSLTQASEARTDGCGYVDHDIFAVCREAGSVDPWVAVPAHHTTISVSSSDMATMLAMPDSTGEQRTAKNAAYKQLLIDQFSIRVNPLETDWAAGLM